MTVFHTVSLVPQENVDLTTTVCTVVLDIFRRHPKPSKLSEHFNKQKGNAATVHDLDTRKSTRARFHFSGNPEDVCISVT
jgi:hypothetical protein